MEEMVRGSENIQFVVWGFFLLRDPVITSGMLAMVASCAAAFQSLESP